MYSATQQAGSLRRVGGAGAGAGAGDNHFTGLSGGYQAHLYGQYRHYPQPKGLSAWVRRGGARATIVTQLLPRHYQGRR